jgi:hypothetical protein
VHTSRAPSMKVSRTPLHGGLNLGTREALGGCRQCFGVEVARVAPAPAEMNAKDGLAILNGGRSTKTIWPKRPWRICSGASWRTSFATANTNASRCSYIQFRRNPTVRAVSPPSECAED